MAYRLIALDLDGTLLTDDRTLPDRNIEAMRAAAHAGALVMIATGRPYRAAAKILEQAGIGGLILSAAGARIDSHPAGETLFEAVLAPDAVAELADLCRQNGWFWFCFAGTDYYYERVCEASRAIERYIGMPGIQLDFSSDHGKAFHKGTVMVDAATIRQAAELLRSRIGDRAEVLISDRDIIDITPKGIVKGVSVLFAARLRGIAPEEVIAVGDTDSDISMIEAAGLGVCMANGSAAAKATADYIAPSNNECGVAHVIETFVLR